MPSSAAWSIPVVTWRASSACRIWSREIFSAPVILMAACWRSSVIETVMMGSIQIWVPSMFARPKISLV